MSIVICYHLVLHIRCGTGISRQILVCLALILLPVIFASFFNKIRLHYLILSIGPFCVFTASVIANSRRITFINVVLFLFFFKFFSDDLFFLKQDFKPLKNQENLGKIVSQITPELKNIKNDFQIRSYAQNDQAFYYPILDTILLAPLEKSLNQKLAKVDDSPFNHVQIGSLQYLVLSCHHLASHPKGAGLKMCLDQFAKDYPQYAILKPLYADYPISIFLAKHD